eukprot:tig00021489_g21698.t1
MAPPAPSSLESSPFRSARLERNSEALRGLVSRAASELDQTDQLLGSLISKIKNLKQTTNIGSPSSTIDLVSPDGRQARRSSAVSTASSQTDMDKAAVPPQDHAYNIKIRELVQKVKDKNVQMQKLVDRVSGLEKDVWEKDQKVFWLSEKIRLLEEESKTKDQDLSSLRAAWDSKLSAKEEQLQLARSAIADFERERGPDREAELRRLKELYAAELRAKDEQIAILQLKLDALEKLHREGAEQGRRQRQQASEALTAKLKALEEEVRGRVMAASELRQVLIPKLRRQNQLLDEWKARCAQLTADAAARDEAAGALEGKMRELQREVQRRVELEGQLAQAIQRRDAETEGRMEALRRDLAAKEAITASLEARVRALEDALEEGGEREAELRGRAGHLDWRTSGRRRGRCAGPSSSSSPSASSSKVPPPPRPPARALSPGAPRSLPPAPSPGEYERLFAAEEGYQGRIRGLEDAVAARDALIRAHQARAKKLGERVGLLNAFVRKLKESGGPPTPAAPAPPPHAPAAAPVAPVPMAGAFHQSHAERLAAPVAAAAPEEEFDFDRFSPRAAFARTSPPGSNPFRSPLLAAPAGPAPHRTTPPSSSRRSAAAADYTAVADRDAVVHTATLFPPAAEPVPSPARAQPRSSGGGGPRASSPPRERASLGGAGKGDATAQAAQAAAQAAAAAAASFPSAANGNTTVCVIVSRPGVGPAGASPEALAPAAPEAALAPPALPIAPVAAPARPARLAHSRAPPPAPCPAAPPPPFPARSKSAPRPSNAARDRDAPVRRPEPAPPAPSTAAAAACAPAPPPSDDVFLEGYLRRQDPISQRFVRRYFRLRGDRLTCCANERSEKAAAKAVRLADVLAVTVVGAFEGRVCNFQISTRSSGWVNAIRGRVRRAHAQQSAGAAAEEAAAVGKEAAVEAPRPSSAAAAAEPVRPRFPPSLRVRAISGGARRAGQARLPAAIPVPDAENVSSLRAIGGKPAPAAAPAPGPARRALGRSGAASRRRRGRRPPLGSRGSSPCGGPASATSASEPPAAPPRPAPPAFSAEACK